MSARPEVVDLLADGGLDAYAHFRLGGKAPRPRLRDGRLPTPAELALVGSATAEDIEAARELLAQRQERQRKEIRFLEAAIRLRTPGSEYLDEVERADGRRWHELLAEESGIPLAEVEEIASRPFEVP